MLTHGAPTALNVTEAALADTDGSETLTLVLRVQRIVDGEIAVRAVYAGGVELVARAATAAPDDDDDGDGDNGDTASAYDGRRATAESGSRRSRHVAVSADGGRDDDDANSGRHRALLSSGGCSDGFVADCSGNGQCCDADWIGDGAADCASSSFERPLGCDLSCYDNDGGDCVVVDSEDAMMRSLQGGAYSFSYSYSYSFLYDESAAPTAARTAAPTLGVSSEWVEYDVPLAAARDVAMLPAWGWGGGFGVRYVATATERATGRNATTVARVAAFVPTVGSAPAALALREGGAPARFAVWLTVAPARALNVSIRSLSPMAQGFAFSPSFLEFSAGEGGRGGIANARTIEARAVNDHFADPPYFSTVSLYAKVLDDPRPQRVKHAESVARYARYQTGSRWTLVTVVVWRSNETVLFLIQHHPLVHGTIGLEWQYLCRTRVSGRGGYILVVKKGNPYAPHHHSDLWSRTRSHRRARLAARSLARREIQASRRTATRSTSTPRSTRSSGRCCART